MSGFSNPLVNDTNALIRNAVKSPNFITGVSGWSINKDGSAEFNNLTIRGTFQGTNFIINSNGMFFYDPTEAFGNLVVSITANAVSGPFGEAVPAGLTIGRASEIQVELFRSGTVALLEFLLNNANFSNPLIDSAVLGAPAFATMFFQGSKTPTVGFRDAVIMQMNSSDAVSSFANLALRYVTDAGIQLQYALVDGTGFSTVACSGLAATKPGTGTSQANPAQTEVWHDLRPLSNAFVGTVPGRYPPQYRKTAEGDIEVVGYLQFPPSGGPNFNGVVWGNLAAGWRPLSNTGHKGFCSFETNVAPVGTPFVQADTAGNLAFHSVPASGMLNNITSIYLRFPLDNTGLFLS